VELLCGQWSYAPLTIDNYDKPILEVTHLKEMLEETTYKKKKERKILLWMMMMIQLLMKMIQISRV
jgi:hypothetical protein